MILRGRNLLVSCSISLSLLIFGCAGLPKTDQPQRTQSAAKEEKTVPIPAHLQEKIRLSEDIGREIYLQDKMAAIGTDVMFENLKDPQKAGIRGYLVYREANEQDQPSGSWGVTFFVDRNDPKVGYKVHITPPATAG